MSEFDQCDRLVALSVAAIRDQAAALVRLDGMVVRELEIMVGVCEGQQPEAAGDAVTLDRHQYASLQIGAALGLADLADSKLRAGRSRIAALCALSGQLSISAAAMALLGIQQSKAIHESQEAIKRFARSGAEGKHNKPGGSREKQKLIRAVWMTGKYSSRDICAEQECASLGMSFSSARKALRGTPDPT